MIQTDSNMSKIEMMDHYLKSYEGNFGYTEVRHIVKSLFGLDLETKTVISREFITSLSFGEASHSARSALDSYIHQQEKELSGADIRKTINALFGINLDAISSLERARISIYSKGQWVVQKENDLFVVHTGPGDIDVKIYPTEYFAEKTGLSGVPIELQQALTGLGYSYDKENTCSFFSNPTGEAVQDEFKGLTMGAIMKAIQVHYSYL
ncbi:hypothetical protein ABES03_07895 [Neobacillus rhizosphaerae]|uniref:hypothetical protein n=1 Tax=Neobacillus rhizosphaerae TaxID=2880965 RepID=UPI003D2B585F